jgi:hypothetical protein
MHLQYCLLRVCIRVINMRGVVPALATLQVDMVGDMKQDVSHEVGHSKRLIRRCIYINAKR